LDGKLIKSYLAQNYSLKCDLHLRTAWAGAAAALAGGTSALGAAVPLATLPNCPAPPSMAWPDSVAVHGSRLHGNRAGEVIHGLSSLNMSEKYF